MDRLVNVWLTILVILGTVVIGGLLYGVIVYGIVNPHTPIAQTVGLNYVIAISTALMFLTLVVGAVTVIWRR